MSKIKFFEPFASSDVFLTQHEKKMDSSKNIHSSAMCRWHFGKSKYLEGGGILLLGRMGEVQI